jgi:hypothetical protein
MRVSGFTVIRNAEIMGYPVVASIKSLLPLVDEFVIGVGQSDDNTKGLIEAINDPKIKIFDDIWDTSKTSGGLMLSEKTNEALKRCAGDWCFYLQADEVIHEQDYMAIYKAMELHEKNKDIQGLLFKYVHFYGSYGIVATARNWYRNEVRIVRNNIGAISVGDAQGFRIKTPINQKSINEKDSNPAQETDSKDGFTLTKPKVVPSGGRIFHYGWVKPPHKMGEKNKHMFRWWHGNKYDDAFNHFAYKSSYGLRYFKSSHPAIMQELVAAQTWQFHPKKGFAHWEMRDYKNLLSDAVEKITGRRFGEHKNYVLLDK